MTTVQLKSETKEKLNDLKLYKRETYDDLINRLVDTAYDDESLSDEEIEDIKISEREIKEGKVRSLSDIMKDLGDNPEIRTN